MTSKLFRGIDHEVVDLKQRMSALRQGKTYYVVAGAGEVASNSKNGLTWDDAFSNMAQAFAVIGSGDTIAFKGNVAEQLTTPAGVFDVTIIGAGNRPRHPDAHTGNGGYSAARWKLPASPTAATPCLKIQQQGWRLANFLMTADTNQVCVDLFRDGGAGDAERDAGHFSCYGMRFDGAGIGIRNNGGVGFVGVYDSLFRGMTTGLAHTTGAGIGTLSWWEILENRFESNTNHAVIPLDRGTVRRNMFMTMTTKGLDASGGTVGLNVVTENVMMGDYDAGYVAGAGDFWFNNYSDDTASVEVEATGLTNSVPVA